MYYCYFVSVRCLLVGFVCGVVGTFIAFVVFAGYIATCLSICCLFRVCLLIVVFGVWCLLLFGCIVGVVVYVVCYWFVLGVVLGCVIALICL